MNSNRSSRRGRPLRTSGPSTRERILDAALEVFAQNGFDGATMRQIAGKVGVSDPALYAHFKGKQAIFDALMQEAGPGVLISVTGDTPIQNMAADRAICEVFTAIFTAWTAPRARVFTSLMMRMGPDGIGSALREVQTRLLPVFTAWQKRGELRPDLSPELAIWQVIGPLSALRLSYLHSASSEADVAKAVTLARDHLNAISQDLTSKGRSL